MKHNKMKKTVCVMLTLAMLIGVSMVAAADDRAGTENGLHSRGAIRYRAGTESVVIDSADLYTLSDRLDAFKVRVAEQLGAIGTYLSKDPSGTPLTSAEGIYALHQEPAPAGSADPLALSFETILEGIAVSQTIPTDPAVYGMESGVTLYKEADGKLSTDGREGAEQICIQAATAENLSAGTAAWVNGELILGTGGDNKAYHDQGLLEGGGSQDTEEPGYVNKAQIINMNNGSGSYIVQEDLKDVFLCFCRVGGHTTPVLSSGEAIKLVLKNQEKDVPWFQWSVYFAPKISKGTIISNLYGSKSDNYMNMLITLENSQKNGKATGFRLAQSHDAKYYTVKEDLTDVFLYIPEPKSKMPNFTPMNDQEYVAFKLLKQVSYPYDDKGNTTYGSLYYIPKLKTGTRISNIYPIRSYLVY